MKQVFRIMGMPDTVIAFDELPERLLEGFELCKADAFPRHWKEWVGKLKKITKIPPEKDVFTGQVRRFDPIVEEDAYFYLVDRTLNPVMDKWKDIQDFVRRVVPKDFRLAENLDSMALPLAPNKTDGVTLDPEEVVVIPIPLEFQEKKAKLVMSTGTEIQKEPENVPVVIDKNYLKCEECGKEFKGSYAKNGYRMHQKKHKKIVAV